jgi:hypothetical protein
LGYIIVESNFYDGTACDFTISAKHVNNAMFYRLAKMFAGYFACLKIHEPEDYPDVAQRGINNLRPLAIALFRELCRQDMQDEEHGADLLEMWTSQAFQLLQSGYGIHL